VAYAPAQYKEMKNGMMEGQLFPDKKYYTEAVGQASDKKPH